MDRTLEGLGALVTGGGTGIGKGIAHRLLEEGAAATIAARREDVLEAAAKDLAAAVPGATITIAVCDVTKTQEIERAVEVAAKPTGRLDIAVANAGGGLSIGSFLDLDDSDWRAMFDVNVFGTVNTLRAAARAMEDFGGALVAVSSVAALNPELGASHYSSAKAAVDMMVRCLAIELAPFKIRVNSVQPAMTITERVRDLAVPEQFKAQFDEVMAQLLDGMLLGRFGTPRDTADTVLHLVGPSGSWITGQTIAVDGGFSLHHGADLRPLVEAAKVINSKAART